MSLIRDLVFTPFNYVELHSVIDGHLQYNLRNGDGAVIFSFSVPPEDQVGATFYASESPKLFMRWIRKEIERRETERLMIEKAKEDWKREQQELHEATLASNRSD